ncbi:MAG: hypothetical protein K8U57_21645 [Planctomycetes bacterium]|nr:hypothetical protein [Planctomycetota bacterium]
MPSPARVHPAGLLVLLVALVFVICLPRSDMLDATVRFDDMTCVLTGQKTEQKFSMVGPLFATPLFYLGRALGDTQRWVWYFNRTLLVLSWIGFWWLLRPLLTAGERLRFIITLTLTSMVSHHLMFFSGEVFTCVMSAFGLAAVVLRRAWWGMPLAILAAVNLPGMIGALGMASVVLVLRTRRLRFLLAAPTAFGLWLLENYVRRGDPWFTGYDGEHGVPTALPYSGLPEFSYPIFFGLLSVLFSFGKGLIFFMPALFMPLREEPGRPAEAESDLRWVYWVWLGYMSGVVLVYAKWWCWSGGWFWGPRFFLFGCFIAALVVARRTANADRHSIPANLLMLVVLVLSGWVALNGLSYQQEGLLRYVPDGPALEFVVWYVPECSALWWPIVTPRPLNPEDWWRLAAIVAGLCHLAAPVVATLWRRLPAHIAAAWNILRTGPIRI